MPLSVRIEETAGRKSSIQHDSLPLFILRNHSQCSQFYFFHGILFWKTDLKRQYIVRQILCMEKMDGFVQSDDYPSLGTVLVNMKAAILL